MDGTPVNLWTRRHLREARAIGSSVSACLAGSSASRRWPTASGSRST